MLLLCFLLLLHLPLISQLSSPFLARAGQIWPWAVESRLRPSNPAATACVVVQAAACVVTSLAAASQSATACVAAA